MDDAKEIVPPGEATGVPDERGLDTLLLHLQSTRGFDFHGYKRASLARRIQRRLTGLGIATYADYLDFLQVHPDEIPQLFNMVLINVTGFFRDPAAWAALSARVARMLAASGPDAPVRVWSAGAASGEEAYSLAMMLAELLGLEALARRVKVYATDLDEDALNEARAASYSARAIEGVPPELVAKYLVPVGDRFAIRRELRGVVLFGRHDLLQDAPISRIDVLACRNTLMYFNADAQTRVLGNLHFALAPGGVLFLGKAEMLLTHLNLFRPLDLKMRLFGCAARPVRGRDRTAGSRAMLRPGCDDEAEQARRAAFDAMPVAAVVLDPSGRIVLLNRRVVSLLGLNANDVGRRFQDLEVSYRPVDLRPLLDQARGTRRISALKAVERVLPTGERVYCDVDVAPLLGESGIVMGTQISFVDCTHAQHLQAEMRRLSAELDASHGELQSTSEELETIHEELQSTIEELETTNEELQSSNEELQSSNEELQMLNDELCLRGDEVGEVSALLHGVLGSLRCGVVMLDGGLRVKTWNGRMQDLWGLRATEVEGEHFLNLDIGLSVEDVRAPVRAALNDGTATELTLDCTNRRGRPVRCRVSVQALRLGRGRGVILIVDEMAV